MNTWDKNRNEIIYKQKIKSVKSTMSKMFNSPTAAATLAARKKTPISKIISTPKENSNNNTQVIGKTEVYQKQHFLKKILRDYGLQQYLRKFYELGYDDNNIQKLANINHKDYDEFFMLLKIFPGHQVKMLALLDNIKRVYFNSQKNNRNVMSTRTGYIKKPLTSTTKRFHSVNTNRIKSKNSPTNLGYSNTTSRLNNKPRSVETLRTNNRILNQFVEGNGFGFNYYLDNEISSKNDGNRENLTSAKSDSRSEIKSFKEDKISNINNEIDQLLNYYLGQLNEKMDDSIDSLDDDDSSLSNLTSIKDLMNANLNANSNLTTNKTDNLLRVDNISDIKMKNNETTNSNMNKSSTINNILEKNSSKDVKILSPLENKSQQNEEVSKSSIKSNKVQNDLNVKEEDLELEEQFYNKYDDFNDNDIKEELPEVKQEEKKFKITPKETPKDILKSNLKETPKSIKIVNEKEKDTPSNKINKSATNLKETKLNNNEEIEKNCRDDEEENLLYTPKCDKIIIEKNDFFDVRLTKSCEGEYLRQNIDQFDTEYMCRCLGLALMKHLESSQEKVHIMDLMNFKDNFSFFNSIFNVNIEFFNTFFNMENKDKISNLDKLDLKEYEERNKKELENTREENFKHDKPISFVSHVRQEKDEVYLNDVKTSRIEEHLHTGGSSLGEMEKDMKLINDYFKAGSKILDNSRYKNVNDKTKNILCQDLNSINEIDSMEYVQTNNLHTVEQKKDKTDYIELLRQSAVDFIGGNKEANHEDFHVQDEIKEQDDEEQDEGEGNYVINDENSPEVNGKEEKFANYKVDEENLDEENVDEYYHQETPLHKIQEDIQEKDDPIFESGMMESNYIIDATNAEKLKNYLLKTVEIYDDDYDYSALKILHKRYVSTPDPQQIFEFCANIILLTKMEKEVIMICLIYIERLMFNTGLLLNSRNWKRITFTALVMASKIWDDDSFENNHFAQVFTHLKIGEINLLERTFLELINYKVYVKCSEYFKYFFIIKSIALKYNFDGLNLVPISVERMMKLQEQAYQVQKKLRRKYSYNNSAQF